MKPHEQNISPHRVPITKDGARFLCIQAKRPFLIFQKKYGIIFIESENEITSENIL